MSNKMLIDAVHPEETRVVMVRDKRVEDFDFEAASRKPLRGNIYLAKVTRVEPSLQAAFVEYGGNRHGFLAFSEIHPDYYQIPQADRAALLEEEVEESEPEATPKRKRGGRRRQAATDDGAARATPDADGETDGPPEVEASAATDEAEASAAQDDADPIAAQDGAEASAGEDEAGEAALGAQEDQEEAGSTAEASEVKAVEQDEEPSLADAAKGEAEASAASAAAAADGEGEEAAAAAQDQGEGEEAEPAQKPKRRRSPRKRTQKSDDGLADPMVTEETEAGEEDSVTSIGNADALEEIPERKRRAPRRNYKIQEVIKRRQIVLVQVVKEERGTKGAALTTYLSLAGRYSVLMPNTDRGGGVSRKITDNTDRKRLKSLVAELEVPDGMGIILRTAGAARTKTEIKRDFEYLLRLWESVRDLTLKSIAPQLVYEEGNLVKRAIRDLYSKEIDEVLVSGETAYREAKDFMKMLMPSHAKNVKPYREATPIFTAYAVENQLDAMFSPQVTLPSKGYIVINPTEALISIDVNSGRSTKESNIEETAYKTNLEAADEVARQLRLRDLAGLIVIDFIDMDDKRHNRQVEKRLKDALKLDRSRIQVGRISSFGLMEMSRQRIRQGMVETSMVPCEVCAGTGHVRSTQSVALHCLRALEEYLLQHANNHVTIRTSPAVALYILNQKRAHLNDLEERFGLEIGVDADATLSGQHLEMIEGPVVEREEGEAPPTAQLSPDAVIDEDEDEVEVEDGADEDEGADASAGERSSRRRRRRRRRGGEEREAATEELTVPPDLETKSADSLAELGDGEGEGEGEDERRGRRRRGRRGGRRHRREQEVANAVAASAGQPDSQEPAGIATGEGGNGTAVDATGLQPAEANVAAATPDQAAPTAAGNGAAEPEADEDDAPAGADGASAAPAEEAAAAGPNGQDRQTDAPAAIQASAPAPSATPEEGEPETTAAEAAAQPAGEAEAATTEPAPEPEKKPERPRRVGWWRARSFFS